MESDDDLNPVARLIKLIAQDVDKEMVCHEITEHMIFAETSLLLKDMASSSKVYRMLKGYLREGRANV